MTHRKTNQEDQSNELPPYPDLPPRLDANEYLTPSKKRTKSRKLYTPQQPPALFQQAKKSRQVPDSALIPPPVSEVSHSLLYPTINSNLPPTPLPTNSQLTTSNIKLQSTQSSQVPPIYNSGLDTQSSSVSMSSSANPSTSEAVAKSTTSTNINNNSTSNFLYTGNISYPSNRPSSLYKQALSSPMHPNSTFSRSTSSSSSVPQKTNLERKSKSPLPITSSFPPAALSRIGSIPRVRSSLSRTTSSSTVLPSHNNSNANIKDNKRKIRWEYIIPFSIISMLLIVILAIEFPSIFSKLHSDSSRSNSSFASISSLFNRNSKGNNTKQSYLLSSSFFTLSDYISHPSSPSTNYSTESLLAQPSHSSLKLSSLCTSPDAFLALALHTAREASSLLLQQRFSSLHPKLLSSSKYSYSSISIPSQFMEDEKTKERNIKRKENDRELYYHSIPSLLANGNNNNVDSSSFCYSSSIASFKVSAGSFLSSVFSFFHNIFPFSLFSLSPHSDTSCSSFTSNQNLLRLSRTNYDRNKLSYEQRKHELEEQINQIDTQINKLKEQHAQTLDSLNAQLQSEEGKNRTKELKQTINSVITKYRADLSDLKKLQKLVSQQLKNTISLRNEKIFNSLTDIKPEEGIELDLLASILEEEIGSEINTMCTFHTLARELPKKQIPKNSLIKKRIANASIIGAESTSYSSSSNYPLLTLPLTYTDNLHLKQAFITLLFHTHLQNNNKQSSHFDSDFLHLMHQIAITIICK